MRKGERAVWLAVCLVLVAALEARREKPKADPVARPRPRPGVRLSMAALHQQGGVPLGWRFTLPPGDAAAGRTTFDELGCPACHRVAGETFTTSGADATGPELTGMGSHHPAAYFAEAILDPDAVLIDAPGYIGEDGHSRMPTYPDMTVGQLSDVVAYLTSLKDGAAASCHTPGAAAPGAAAPAAGIVMTDVDLSQRPAPPSTEARAFFAQTYDVPSTRLRAFEAWFAERGRRAFLDADGVVSVETYVDVTRPAPALTTVIGFRDEAALRTFMADPTSAELWKEFDAFVGPHGHLAAARPFVYRAPGLSAP